ncbi:Cyclochlorotine biosynthesis protein O [Apiospora arundinis]|jgi:exo-beta-1,3-glucanase (GH17 family)|uniref:Probable beta-glucosidase btgE n=1 Tax=Apiospora arundinis TaxID=335852 RepID=A0ABR2J8B6_9PEZI
MKGTYAVAATAALAGAASASAHRRHAHDVFHGLEKKDANATTCVPECTTIYSTWYGEATLHNPPPPPATSTSKPVAALTTPAAKTSTTEVAVVPTPAPQLCPTPGVYTFPATTITVDKTTTVCGASMTSVPKGTHTLGGATTAVTGATTITVPYATVKTSEGVTTSTIDVTTTFCPAAGTYTVGKHTTVVTEDSTIAVPSITSYLPGTYTRPEVQTTITKTSDVVYCPYEAVKPTQPASAPASKPAVPTTVVPAAPVAPIPTSAVPVYSAVPQVPASSAADKPKPKPSNTPSKGNGKAPWAMTYTPYAQSGQCKSKGEVMKDVEALTKAGITTLRTYSTDCDTLPNVGAACKAYGCKMIIGIFIDAPHCSANNPTVSEQINAIKNWAQFDLVEIISVGNEAMLNGYCTAGEIAGLINTCKSTFTGYSGGYTTADTIAAWQKTGVAETLCGLVEYPAANIHPFFNTQTVASQAGAFVKSQMEILNGICGKAGKCYETGWPSQGKCMGAACPGKLEQEVAVTSILKECPKDIVLFSLEDDLWKSDQTECACEKSWGCKDILKSVISLSL